MFGFFKSKKESENTFPIPIEEDTRKWLEEAYGYLFYEFDSEKFRFRKLLTPTKECFDYKFDGNKDEVIQLARQLADIMEINFDEIQIVYFDGFMAGMRQEDGILNPGGQYLDQNEEGKYTIALAENLLKDAESLIAIIAHEYGHVKLLGEKRLDQNDEYLTDMVPLFFGLGIFGANTSFRFSSRTYSRAGYLSQMDWGYLLAMYAYCRDEKEPEWLRYLNATLQKDVKLCLDFLQNSGDSIFTRVEKDK